MTRIRRKLPFKEVKKFTISILNELDKEDILLEDLVEQVHNKIVENGRASNNKTTSTIQRRYGATVSKIAKSVGWPSYTVKYNSRPKTHLRRVNNVL